MSGDVKPGASSAGVPMAGRLASGGGAPAGAGPASAPVIVRPTGSRVTKSTAAVPQSPQLAQVMRWDSGDPDTARVVRVTMTGAFPSGVFPLANAALSAAGQNLWTMAALVEYGAQSGASQTIWVPVPCDFDLTATYVNVKACSVPLAPVCHAPPTSFVSADQQGVFGTMQCSIAEGESGGGPSVLLAATSFGNGFPLRYPPVQIPGVSSCNVTVTDFVVTNASATTGYYVGLIDRPPAWTLIAGNLPDVSLDMTTGVYVAPQTTQAIAYDDRPFFWGVVLVAQTAVGGNLTSTPNLSGEIRGRVWNVAGLPLAGS